MKFHIVTLFPESFASYISTSIIGRAISEKKIQIKFYNPRDFAVITAAQKKNDRPYARVDDKPYGGGPGMVMQAEPVIKAIAKALGKKTTKQVPVFIFAASGKQFTNEFAREILKNKIAKKSAKDNSKKLAQKEIILVCGHYEGVDARVKTVFKATEISIGPYILTGGELPAMIVVDIVSRQIEGVLGNFNSLEDDRVSTSEAYTRPEVFSYKGKKYKVPPVLLSGNHKLIEEWKKGKTTIDN